MVRQLVAAATMVAAFGVCRADQLVYTPVNPAFGGNPLNGSFLLNEAQLQNSHTNPNAAGVSGAQQLSPLQQFNRTLEQIILSRIASAVSGSIIDSSGNLKPGTVQTADFIISIVDLGNGTLRITTTDKSSGQTSSFDVSSTF